MAGGADIALVTAIRGTLRAAADPAKAGPMQAYMKSAMPYLGISAPRFRVIAREVFAAHRLTDARVWRDTARALWDDAAFREERYAAILLTDLPVYLPFQRLAVLPLYRHMITTGAWWDFVDLLASHQIGLLLRLHPRPMAATLRTWAVGRDMWLRRAAILAQLGFKEDTDLTLLYDCIEPSVESREFFLRKAIGWALRQHARTDPREVRRFVSRHRDRLSPLSVREALKHHPPVR